MDIDLLNINKVNITYNDIPSFENLFRILSKSNEKSLCFLDNTLTLGSFRKNSFYCWQLLSTTTPLIYTIKNLNSNTYLSHCNSKVSLETIKPTNSFYWKIKELNGNIYISNEENNKFLTIDKNNIILKDLSYKLKQQFILTCWHKV